ncbi:hypothetical protein C8Q79DRAFT_369738 [Trametes meyenii]|nr:hypothetical protein C8Q79DRAFT_369738 [Trametes meyenii]
MGSEASAHTGVFATARRKLSRTSVGSLFTSYHAALQRDVQDTFGIPRRDTADSFPGSRSSEHAFDIKLPGPANLRPRSGSSSGVRRSRASSISNRLSFSDVKQTVSNLAARGRTRSASLNSSLPTALLTSSSNALKVPDTGHCVIHPSAKPHENHAWNENGAISYASSSACTGIQGLSASPSLRSSGTHCLIECYATPLGEDNNDTQTLDLDDGVLVPREEIRKGKQPQYERKDDGVDMTAGRRSYFPTVVPWRPTTRDGMSSDSSVWYGLEYALEISKIAGPVFREVEIQHGEYSKSRQAGAALHDQSLVSTQEEENYDQWQAWHEYLEREDICSRLRRVQ